MDKIKGRSAPPPVRENNETSAGPPDASETDCDVDPEKGEVSGLAGRNATGTSSAGDPSKAEKN